MVGIVSSSNVPSVMALTRVVFPAFWSPTMAIYNYLLKNLDFIQSNNLLKKPNIFVFVVLLFINCYKNIQNLLYLFINFVKELKLK